MAHFKRILLKLSGESLEGKLGYGIDEEVLYKYVNEIKRVTEAGVEVAIVIGGGNIFRGLSGTDKGIDRVKGDYMGMLATIINSMALHSAFESIGMPSRLFTSIRMEPIGEYFNPEKIQQALRNKEVVIIGGGTSNPYFTTDTASALRAIEIKADALLKGTRVNGVYNADPEKDPKAVKYDKVSFDEVIQMQLKVMDITAFTLCRENKMPIVVFDMNGDGNLLEVCTGQNSGTLVHV